MSSKAMEAAPAGTQAIQRASRIVRELGEAGQDGLRIVDLVRRLDLERPTLHRILQCLVAEDLVAHDAGTKRYFLGAGFFELGLIASPRFSLRQVCEIALSRIAAETGDTVFLAVRRGGDGLIIDRREGATPIRTMPLDIGARRPLGIGASGLAMLMPLPDDDVRHIAAENAPRLVEYNVTPQSLVANVFKAREHGYAYSRGYYPYSPGFGQLGISGIGLPLTNAQSTVLGAISVTALSLRMTSGHRSMVAEVLRRHVNQLRSQVGAALPDR